MRIRQLTLVGVFIFLGNPGFTQDSPEFFDDPEEVEGHHCLLMENSFTVGAGAIYSFGLNEVGVNTRVYYNIGEHVCFGPEVNYLKKHDKSVFELNLIAHYVFETKLLGLYPVAGVNYSKEFHASHADDGFGVVFGAGIHRNFNKITVFTEYTHIEGKFRNDLVTLGLLFNIK